RLRSPKLRANHCSSLRARSPAIFLPPFNEADVRRVERVARSGKVWTVAFPVSPRSVRSSKAKVRRFLFGSARPREHRFVSSQLTIPRKPLRFEKQPNWPNKLG